MSVSSGVQLLTLTKNFKLAMRVIQIKPQGMHVYLRARPRLNEITAWIKKKKSRHI